MRLGLLVLMLAFLGCTEKKTSNVEPRADAQGGQQVPENVIQYYIDENGNIVPTLINGEEVSLDDWKAVVRIRVGNAGCSATVVGPKIVVTAAHCGATGSTAEFALGGKNYKGKIERSSLYPSKDHDVSVIVLDQEISKDEVGVFASIGGAPAVGSKGYLLGYGCTKAGGGGGNDGKLRAGFATIKAFSGYDIVSSEGAALCFGDSGGPMMVDNNKGKPVLMGVNSKGNIRDTNYNASTVSNESRQFWSAMASKYSSVICGVNGTAELCGDGPTPPPPPPPPPPGCDVQKQKELLLGVAACFQIPIVLPTDF